MKLIDLNKENEFLLSEVNNKETYRKSDRGADEIKRIYTEWEKQTDFIEGKLRETEDQFKNALIEINELKNESKYLKRILDDKEKHIQMLESRESTQKIYQIKQQYEPKAAEPSPSSLYLIEELSRKLKQSEEENEKLREQALKADRENERLKENIILREREIHNVKKSMIPKDSMPRDSTHKESLPKDKAKQSDFALSIETNPNLVNEMARMSGSSGFKYGMKGPYDESLEKLRKEFSLQQKELGLDTLSEMSFDRHEEVNVNQADKTYALLMGQSVRSPTGDLKVDYDAVLEENEQLKLIVKEMRREMEVVVKKLTEVRSNEAMNSGSKFKPVDKTLNSAYLDSANLRLHDLEQENEILKGEISRLKSTSKRDQNDGGNAIERLEKKLEEKKIIINKLKEERDNLLQLWSEMKIQINSMKKAQDLKALFGGDKQIDNNEAKSRIANFSRNKSNFEVKDNKSINLGGFKSRLDNLGENVQELFSEFKSVLNQNKKGNHIFSWKNLPFDNKKEVVVSGEKWNKLFEKFEKIQKDISNEQENISTNKMIKSRNSSQKSKKSNKSKSPIRGKPIKLNDRNFSQNKIKKEFKRFNESKNDEIY